MQSSSRIKRDFQLAAKWVRQAAAIVIGKARLHKTTITMVIQLIIFEFCPPKQPSVEEIDRKLQ
jgi:hypothetical protein